MRVSLAVGAGLALAACATTPPPISPGVGRCDAPAAQSLVGTNVAAVTFPAGANVRVVCTTCTATRDYRPDRLNVRFDEATGIIRSVDCG